MSVFGRITLHYISVYCQVPGKPALKADTQGEMGLATSLMSTFNIVKSASCKRC